MCVSRKPESRDHTTAGTEQVLVTRRTLGTYLTSTTTLPLSGTTTSPATDLPGGNWTATIMASTPFEIRDEGSWKWMQDAEDLKSAPGLRMHFEDEPAFLRGANQMHTYLPKDCVRIHGIAL